MTKTKWITVDELRDWLSISKNKAYQIANEESLEVVKIGRSLRINEESLTRWLESQRIQNPRGGDDDVI